MARFSLAERRWRSVALNLLGGLVVAFTLAVNLARGYPVASLGAAILIASVLYSLWIRAGRPRGIARVEERAQRTLSWSARYPWLCHWQHQDGTGVLVQQGIDPRSMEQSVNEALGLIGCDEEVPIEVRGRRRFAPCGYGCRAARGRDTERDAVRRRRSRPRPGGQSVHAGEVRAQSDRHRSISPRSELSPRQRRCALQPAPAVRNRCIPRMQRAR